MRAARPLVVPVLIVVVAASLLTGCLTGKRAYFSDGTAPLAPVADPAIAAVVAKLEAVTNQSFTATYDIITKFGNSRTTATVAQSTPLDRSITIGHIRFLDVQAGARTCDLNSGSCVDGLQDQQVSDTQLTHAFYAASPALRLRQDVTTMVSAATASSKQIAGQNATCVQVYFAAGNKTYCALDDGLLAQQDTPDVRIDLTSLTSGADQSLFTTNGPPNTSAGATAPAATTTTG